MLPVADDAVLINCEEDGDIALTPSTGTGKVFRGRLRESDAKQMFFRAYKLLENKACSS